MQNLLLIGSARRFVLREDGPLRRSEFNVLTAATGEEGLKLHRSEQAGLIVLDLDLPDMPGDEFCRQVRTDDTLRHVSLLVLSDQADAGLDRVAACGANAYLARPVDAEKLIGQITRLLGVPQRADYRVLVRISLTAEHGAVASFCSSQNLSVHGMLIESEKAFPVGAAVECSFFLPGPTRVVVAATVVREHPFPDGSLGFGIRFDTLRPNHKRAIQAFIAKHPPAVPAGDGA